MEIFSWNCHYGLTNTKLESILKLKTVDVFVIQECREFDFDLISDEFDKHWYGDPTESGGNNKKELGVGIFAKKQKFSIKKTLWSDKLENYRYVVPYEIINKKTTNKYIITNIWTKGCDKNNNKYKNYHEPIYNTFKFCEEFISEKNMIVLGDFNTGSVKDSVSEKWYIDLKKEFKSYDFINCANERELEPTYFKGNGKWLDDHCFIKKGLTNKYKLNFGDYTEWISSEMSDHIPLILQFE